MIHFADEETTVEVRTLPKPDPSVIVQVEAKRGKISFVKGNKILSYKTKFTNFIKIKSKYCRLN